MRLINPPTPRLPEEQTGVVGWATVEMDELVSFVAKQISISPDLVSSDTIKCYYESMMHNPPYPEDEFLNPRFEQNLLTLPYFPRPIVPVEVRKQFYVNVQLQNDGKYKIYLMRRFLIPG